MRENVELRSTSIDDAQRLINKAGASSGRCKLMVTEKRSDGSSSMREPTEAEKNQKMSEFMGCKP
jgi:hypothetical protein